MGKETNSRRRNVVAKVFEEKKPSDPTSCGKAPMHLPLFKPKREGIITLEMADPNLTMLRYRSQEISFTNNYGHILELHNDKRT